MSNGARGRGRAPATAPPSAALPPRAPPPPPDPQVCVDRRHGPGHGENRLDLAPGQPRAASRPHPAAQGDHTSGVDVRQRPQHAGFSPTDTAAAAALPPAPRPPPQRCKTRVLDKLPAKAGDLPMWNYDGSSTGQVCGQGEQGSPALAWAPALPPAPPLAPRAWARARAVRPGHTPSCRRPRPLAPQAPGDDSEVYLVPRAIYKDPFRGGDNILVRAAPTRRAPAPAPARMHVQSSPDPEQPLANTL